jgi:hypothetical protein
MAYLRSMGIRIYIAQSCSTSRLVSSLPLFGCPFLYIALIVSALLPEISGLATTANTRLDGSGMGLNQDCWDTYTLLSSNSDALHIS